MTTPIQHLKAKKKEINDIYNFILHSKYGSGNRAAYAVRGREAFEDSKRDDLKLIKKQLDDYQDAINSLVNIKNLTF